MLIYLKRILAVLVIIALLLAGVQCFNRVLQGYSTDWYHPEMYPKNSVDVAFFGSSHVYNAIIPQLLMDEYGIAAANIVSSGLLGSNTLQALDMMLEYQRPQVIVMDLFGFLAPYLYEADMQGDAQEQKNDRTYITRQRLVNAMPVTAWHKYPWIVKDGMQDPAVFPYSSLTYLQHNNLLTSNWRNLTGKTLLQKKKNLGYEFAFEQRYQPGLDVSAEELEAAHVYEPYWEQLDAIFALAQKEGLEIIYTFFPYMTNNAERKLMEEITDYLSQKGVTYLTMTELMDGAMLDDHEDFRDRGHCNYYGANKLSWFWGDYLYTNYDLPDRSEDDDPRYDLWKERPYGYEGHEAAGLLSREGDYQFYAEYLSLLNDEYITVAVIAGTETFAQADNAIWPLEEYLGADPESLGKEKAVTVLVLHGGQILRQQTFSSAGQMNLHLLDCGYEIKVYPGQYTAVRIDGKEASRLSQNGVMFLVTDALQEWHMDKATFTFEEEDPIRMDFEYEEE
ncbi:MAG: hypothetical protein E7323_04885 [Clostridiales bacterium]|nr:hypothetical protein [Clostridiales bacterium]